MLGVYKTRHAGCVSSQGRGKIKEKSMRSSRVALTCLCGFLGLTILACSRPGGASKKVAFVTNNAADFWTIARKGCEQAGRELADVEVEFRIPSDGTAAGRQAGDLIKEAMPQGGRIMVFVGKIDARNAQERYQGIKETLQGSKVEIIDVRTDDADRVRAKSNVADTLVKYPDIKGLVGLWSYNGPAIINALKEAGKLNQVKVVCFDEEDETLAGVKAGTIFATVVQQPFEFGYQAIKMMAAVLNGDKSLIPGNKQIIVPTLVIKQESVEEFQRKINQLRGRS